MCFLGGIYPDSLKLARVIPIFKGGNKNDSSLCHAADLNLQRILTQEKVKIRCNPRAANLNSQRILTGF